MKRLSIKARVVLWFTGFFVLLSLIGVVYLLSFSHQMSSQQLKENLKDVVSDAVKTAEFRHGELKDGAIDYYNKGVSIFIYDTKGHLLAPKVNQGIQIDAVLEDDTVKAVEYLNEDWFLYDLYAKDQDTGFWVRGIITRSGAGEVLKRMVWSAVIAIPILLGVAVWGGWFLTKKAFAPVGEIAASANAISSANDLSHRIPDDGSKDELSRIAASMNLMLTRLEHSFEHERQFTSDVSHELRTPTAIIISQCEYALSEGNQEEWRGCANTVLRQARRMSSIISQLLLLARAENGTTDFQLLPMDLSSLSEIIGIEMKEVAKESEIELYYDIQPDLRIKGEETLIIRMLTNVISNGIRYNKQGGSVALTVKQMGSFAVIEIKDTGIGIEKQDFERIFERFYQKDASRSSEGTGLGLSMVKWIVQLHGGTIGIESESLKGSTFLIKIPIL